MKNIGLIPARAGSKRLPRKNLKIFAGKPLIEWTFIAASNSTLLDEIYLSTDSLEIIEIAKSYNIIVPFVRPKNLSEDDTTANEVVDHFLHSMSASPSLNPILLVFLQPTSPLRISEDIDSAIHKIIQNRRANSLFTYTELPDFLNPKKIVCLDQSEFLDRKLQEATTKKIMDLKLRERVTIRNGAAVYATKIEDRFRGLIYGDTIGLNMPWIRSIDIDTQEDFILAEAIFRLLNISS